jgi:putative ABC transport system permease protein
MALPLMYNLRNLFVRKVSTALTFVVVAVVVLVLAVLLSFAAGISASLVASGWPENLLALKPGATAESTSLILPKDADRVMQTPGVARNVAGESLISRELCVQTNVERIGAAGGRNRNANVAVRGVDDVAFEVHPEVRIVEGRCFAQGQQEVIVGRAASRRYNGLSIGATLSVGRAGQREYRVVGVFESRGNSFESEIWGPRTMLSDSYARNLVSAVVVRLESPAAAERAIAYINGPAVELEARRETTYYDDLSSKTREIVALTSILVTIMGIGAAFAVANTMFAAVDARRREIAMLRTIGFRSSAIVGGFVLEALLICLAACAAGLLGSLAFSGRRQDFLSDATWTVLAYETKVTPMVALLAVGVAVSVALIGSALPAGRAARVRVIDALRRA